MSLGWPPGARSRVVTDWTPQGPGRAVAFLLESIMVPSVSHGAVEVAQTATGARGGQADGYSMGSLWLGYEGDR